MKSNRTICLSIFATLSITPLAFATEGSKGGGGGEAVLCYKDASVLNEVYEALKESESKSPDDDMSMAPNLRLENLRQPPQVLDYYEATRPTGLPSGKSKPAALTTNGLSPDEIYQKLSVLDPEFYALFKPYITTRNQWKAHAGVIKLRDSKTSYLFAQNCLKVQVAHFNDDNEIAYYNSQIVERMDAANIDTLKIHEDLYFFHRAGFKANQKIAQFFLDYIKTYPRQAETEESTLWARRTMSKELSSDSTRNLVGYLITAPSFQLKDFQKRAAQVAIGTRLERQGNFFTSNEYLIRDYRAGKPDSRILQHFERVGQHYSPAKE